MSKGISLEEFKNQLETDSQKKCIAQEEAIQVLQEKVKKQQGWIEALQNRCLACQGL